MKFSTKFLVAAGIQVLCLFGMIGYKYAQLAGGRKVFLEVPVPRDPRSLFSGDYVIIRYAINYIDLSKIESDVEGLKYGDTAYVTLSPKGDIWVPVAVSRKKPEDAELFIKGKVTNMDDGHISMEYGIEQYYVPEDRGMEFEDRLRKTRKAKVSISPFGNAATVAIPD